MNNRRKAKLRTIAKRLRALLEKLEATRNQEGETDEGSRSILDDAAANLEACITSLEDVARD